ncbi:MAG: glycosyltransferase family 9 protein [Verrucomicrobia bacterium]|nr:glycosyltransferase family 9 protein [Verrucomicrobiota bacterium]
MNLDTQRRIDRWVGVPLCRLLTLMYRLCPPRSEGEPRKILIILLSEMGSLVLTVPMFQRLKETYPEAAIHVLLFARNRAVLDLLGCVRPECVITIRDTSLGALLADSLRAVRRMRRVPIDTVIDCELFSRVSSVYSALSGAARRVGFHRHTQEGLYRGGFINRPVPYNPYQHIALQFLALAEALRAHGRPLVKRQEQLPAELPPLAMDAAEIAAARAALAHDFPHARLERLILIYPGGGFLPIRTWPESQYAALCQALCARGYTVGVTGLPEDQALAQRVLSACPPDRSVNLAGYTKSLRELVRLFFIAELLITNDGGPGHFAALTPLPSLVFFGPETPLLYRPISPRTRVLYRGLSCSPCVTAYNHRNSPCDGNNVCLKEITVAEVLQSAEALLRLAHGHT